MYCGLESLLTNYENLAKCHLYVPVSSSVCGGDSSISCKAVVRDDKIFHVKYLEVCLKFIVQ